MDYAKVVLELAHTAGNHPSRWVIWDEGLVAGKQGKHLTISPPGARLANLQASDLITLKPAVLLEALSVNHGRTHADGEILGQARVVPDAPVPGPEAFLAAELLAEGWPALLVLLQPVALHQILASPRARQFADRRVTVSESYGLGRAMPLVPYADPGITLAKEMRSRIALWRDRYKAIPRIVLLQNQGVIVLGDTVAEIVETTEKLMKAADVFIGASALGGPQFLSIDNLDRALMFQRALSLVGPADRAEDAGE
jgi:rhamnose utilization protein RhaD (predicted bifunctional aldolase and dehydrogenase)